MKILLKPKKSVNLAIFAAVVSVAFFAFFSAVWAQDYVPWIGPTAQPPGNNVNGLIFNRNYSLPVQAASINIDGGVYAEAFCFRRVNPATGDSPYCISNWEDIIGQAGDYWTLDDTGDTSLLYATDPGWLTGIGTDAPAVKLEVNDGSAAPTQVRITDIAENPELQVQYGAEENDHWAIYNNQPADSLNIWGGGDNRLTILQNGRVGLGTDSPNQQLEITGNFRLPATTAATGVIYSGNNTLLHTFGARNIFLGIEAGNLTAAGTNNTGIGYRALFKTAGSANTAVGEGALGNNTTGHSNTAIGADSLVSNISGYQNIANGYAALYSNTTGVSNTAVGYSAGQFNLSGSANTFLGVGADVFNDDFYVETAMNDLTNATAIGAYAKVGASNAMVLGGTGEGAVKVGIGLINPNADIHIYRDFGDNAEINIQSLAGAGQHWGIYQQRDDDALTTLHNEDGDLRFWQGGNRIVIANEGKVGIGVIDPGQKLDIAGALRLRPSTTPAAANGVIYYDSAANKFRCYENGAWADCIGAGAGAGLPAGTLGQTLRHDGAGWVANSLLYNDGLNVGIGQAPDPLAKLDILGSIKIADGSQDADKVLTSDAVGLASWKSLSEIGGIGGAGTLNYVAKFTPDGNTIGNSSIFNDASGNVGFGTILPNSLIHVYQASGNNAEIDIQSVGAAGQHWGIYQERSGGDLRFWNVNVPGDSNALTIQAGGNVGIGVSAPAAKLDILGSIKIADGSQDADKVLTSNDVGLASWKSLSELGGVGLADGLEGQTLRYSVVNGWEANSFLYNEAVTGNIGLGTTDPNKNLHIKTAVGNNAEIDIQSGANGWWGIYQEEGSGDLRFWNTDNRMAITSAGKVGIGTILLDSAAKLEVAGQVKITGGSPGVDKVLASNDVGLASWRNLSDLGDVLPFGTAGQTLRHDGANWVANSLLYNDGLNVGIGVSAPAAKLDILGPIKIADGSQGDKKVLTSNDVGLASWKSLSEIGGAGLADGLEGQTLRYSVVNGWEANSFLYNEAVTGNIGLGTADPKNKLDVEGGAVIGAAYSGTSAAPANGLLVEGNVGIGTNAPNNKIQVADLINFDNAKYGTFLGYQAGRSNTSNYNSAIGYQALYTNTNGIKNSAMGYQALYTNTNGSLNSVFGAEAGFRTTGNSNIFLGFRAGYNQTLNSNLLIIDNQSRGTILLPEESTKSLIYGVFDSNPASQKLTFNAKVGIGTDTPNKSLHIKTAVGNNAEIDIQSGDGGHWGIYQEEVLGDLRFWKEGVSNGGNALTIEAEGNVGIGTIAPNNLLQVAGLINFDDANFNTFLGKDAFNSSNDSQGSKNTGVGWYAGFNNKNPGGLDNRGTQNTYVGNYAGLGGVIIPGSFSGWGNVALGASALRSITTGSRNVAIGATALFKNTIGGNNIAVGSSEGNTALGGAALYNNISGHSNIAIGTAASYENTAGIANTVVGLSAYRYSNTGGNNTIMGYYADGRGVYNEITNPNPGSNPRSNNTIIGAWAGHNNISGGNNVFLGKEAGYFQTTNSDLLIIDNQQRGTLAAPENSTESLIYGVFATNPLDQRLTFNADVTINGTLNGQAADYAEWFEKEETAKPGDLIGLNLKTGKARRYRAGDKFIGIYSAKPAYVGNRLKETEEEMAKTHILVGLLGQLDFDRAQTVIKGGLVQTKDGQEVGVLLANGKVLVGR